MRGATLRAGQDRSTRGRARWQFYRWLTYLILFPLFAGATVFFGSLSLIASLFDGSGRIQHRIARIWAGWVLRISLSPVRVIGRENLAAAPIAVYAANHLSYMDTPVVFHTLPFQFRILARHDLFRIPFIGWYLRRSGQIPVDSSSLRSSISSLNGGVRMLQSGMPLMIFPEGGRTDTGHPKPFQNGAAYMAVRAGVPLVPMALVGTYELMPMHAYHLHPRPLYLVIGEPISVAGETTRTLDRLTARLQAAIASLYYQYAAVDTANGAATAIESLDGERSSTKVS